MRFLFYYRRLLARWRKTTSYKSFLHNWKQFNEHGSWARAQVRDRR